MVHSDNGILFKARKKWAIKSWKKYGENLNAYYWVKEANLKRISTIGHSGKGKTKEKVKRSVVPGPGEVEGGTNTGGGCTEDF